MLQRLSLCLLTLLVVVQALSAPGHLSMPLSMALELGGLPDAQHDGLDLYEKGESAKAVEWFLEAVAARPTVAEYHFNLALLYTNAPEAARAITGLQDARLYAELMHHSEVARSLRPSDFQFAEAYASNFYLSGRFGVKPDWEGAVSAWEYCLALREAEPQEPGNFNDWRTQLRIPLLMTLARLTLQLGQRQQAAEYVEEVLTIMPDSALAKAFLQRIWQDGETSGLSGRPIAPGPFRE